MITTIARRQRGESAGLPTWGDAVNMHPVLQLIYTNRGVTDVAELDCGVKRLTNFQHLKGINNAVKIISNAIHRNAQITIVGDFDADGATSTALCLLALTDMGAKRVDHIVPNRFEFGYGLSTQIVDIAARQNTDLIITVDNGISCIQGVDHAKKLGIDVVITDHHLPAEQLPNADAIVNPNQIDCPFPSKMLAGVGVAFYVMLALRAELQASGWFAKQQIPVPNLASYLDLVAVGTVADVVPLDNNNRILVHQGLQRIRAGKCRPGLTAMLDVANRDNQTLSAIDLGFVIGPRLNAAGRLDDMSLGIACLLTTDQSHARNLAVELDRLNQQRKTIELAMQQEAVAKVSQLNMDESLLPSGIVVYQQDFHAGVIGIVAGRLKEQFHRPTIVFADESDEVIKGSARSIQGVHIRDVLERINTRSPDLILKFGGHAMAAGLSLKKVDYSAFVEAFNISLADWQETIGQSSSTLTDGGLPDNCLNLDFAQQLRQAGPWGQGFEEPVFDDVFSLIEQRIVGGKHLKMILKTNQGQLIDAIAFNIDGEIWPNANARLVHLAYKLDINHFRGKSTLQLIAQTIKVTSQR